MSLGRATIVFSGPHCGQKKPPSFLSTIREIIIFVQTVFSSFPKYLHLKFFFSKIAWNGKPKPIMFCVHFVQSKLFFWAYWNSFIQSLLSKNIQNRLKWWTKNYHCRLSLFDELLGGLIVESCGEHNNIDPKR